MRTELARRLGPWVLEHLFHPPRLRIAGQATPHVVLRSKWWALPLTWLWFRLVLRRAS
ncbi:MAG: hypothetical protein AMXMBFR56_72450 [Polyangiaceae bacterium]